MLFHCSKRIPYVGQKLYLRITLCFKIFLLFENRALSFITTDTVTERFIAAK